MVVVPAATPDTTPELFIVATEVLLLLHVPPVVASLSEVVDPTQTLVVPSIAPGSGFTVTTVVLKHVVPKMYEITAVPKLLPVTHPVEATVATEVLLLLHVPPVVVSDKQFVPPRQMFAFPEIAAGSGFTFIVFIATQPTGDVASIVTAPPVTEVPVTIPVPEPTVATDVLLLLQVTPAVASVSVMVLP